MQFAQVLLTDEQALMSATAIRLILEDEERYVLTDEERDGFTKLAGFFGLVAERPTAFAPKGAMARSVKSIVRRAKGAAQPVSQTKARKAKRSQGQQKRDRQAARELRAHFNAAREKYEAERAEMEAMDRELEERFANEPRVQVVDVNGRILMSEIPASMVVPMVDEPAPEVTSEQIDNAIYVPGQRPDA